MSYRKGILGLTGVMALIVATLWLTGSAGAIHNVLIEYTVVSGPPNSLVEISTEEVEPWLQGESCAIEVEIDNNDSVHEGTALVITSGDDTVTVPDVETEPGLVTFAEGALILGENVTVSVYLGPDGITSGGVRVDFLCDQVPPPTTTEPPGPTVVTTTEAPTTTEQPPPTVFPQTTFAPTTTVSPDTTLPPTQPEPPTAAQPTFTG